jgi:hypothetical protein
LFGRDAIVAEVLHCLWTKTAEFSFKWFQFRSIQGKLNRTTVFARLFVKVILILTISAIEKWNWRF